MLWGTKFVARFKCKCQCRLCFDKRGASLSFNPLGSSDSLSSTRDYIFFVFFPARDNETRSAGHDLTDKELLKVVKTLGKEWEQVAIHLDLKTKDLDDIKAEERNVAMQKFKMLQLWQHRRPGKATVEDLLRGLEDMEELPVETRLLLKSNVLHLHTQGRLGAIGSLKALDEKLCFVSKYIMS